MDRKVNLFLVGVGKAGTSGLAKMLQKHPDIYIPIIKEPNYFSQYSNKEWREIDPAGKYNITEKTKYLKLFKYATNEHYLGDASTSYFHSERAAFNIYKYNPEAKIIIILRDPVDRAFSHYLMHLRGGLTKLSFKEAVESDYYKNSKYNVSNFIYISLYYAHVKRYMDIFGERNVKILYYDDLAKDHKNILSEIFNFLKISPIDIPNIRENTAKIPKNKLAMNVLYYSRRIGRILPKFIKDKAKLLLYTEKKPEISPETRKWLIEKYFYEDIKKLEKLLERDLSDWYRI